MRAQLRKTVAVVASPLILVMGLAFTQAQSGYAQTQAPSDTQTNRASDVEQNAVPCESSKANTNNQQPGSMAAYQGTQQAGMNQDKSGATHYVVDPNHVEIEQGRVDAGR